VKRVKNGVIAAATACTMIFVIVFFRFYVFRTATNTPTNIPNQVISIPTFFSINGLSYSTNDTQYGKVLLAYYVLLPNPNSYYYTIHPDGTILYVDGTIAYPNGSTFLPNGDIKLPDGTVVKDPNGTQYPGGIVIYPNGTAINYGNITITSWGIGTEELGNIKGMMWRETFCYLTYPNETVPADGCLMYPFEFPPPVFADLLGPVLINGWMHEQTATNFRVHFA
jgi:hypothetical protein